jgi:hypothetical protein
MVMALKERFVDLYTGDKDLDRLTLGIKRYLAQLDSIPFLDGVMMEAEVTTTATNFAHKLGRQPVGWLVVDRTEGPTIWRTDWSADFIKLQSSAEVSVKLWVF